MSDKSHIISFRLTEDEIKKLNTFKGEKSISAYCKDFILSCAGIVYTNVNIDLLNLELKHKNELLDSVNNRVHDLENTNGFLISQIMEMNKLHTQILLPESNKKSWWHFW